MLPYVKLKIDLVFPGNSVCITFKKLVIRMYCSPGTTNDSFTMIGFRVNSTFTAIVLEVEYY